MTKVTPGDTICLRGGTYPGFSVAGSSLDRGTWSAPITLTNYPGESAKVVGPSSVQDPDYWIISNIDWSAPGSTERILSVIGGTGYVIERNDIHDGAYAGLLVGASTIYGPPIDHIIRYNSVHDTGAVNFYYNPSRSGRGGLIERNLFYNSGTENLKVGWGGTGGCSGSNYENFGVGEVTVRFNTMYNAQRGALIVAEAGGLYDVDVYRNLFAKQPDHLVRFDNVEGCLGDKVYVHDNAGGLAPRFAQDFGDSPVNMSHLANNLFPIDPQFDSISTSGFHPQNTQAQPYGRYAGESTTTPPPPEISVVGTSMATDSGKSENLLALARPVNAAPGDLLLSAISARGNPTITAPSGWTLVATTFNSANLRTSVYSLTCASAGCPSSSTWSSNSSSDGLTGIVTAFRGVASGTLTATTQANSSAGSATAPSVTAGSAGRLVTVFSAVTSPVFSTPSGMTEHGDVADVDGTYRSATAVDSQAIVSGATGTRVASMSSSASSNGISIVLGQL